jgi:hypothetical protein
MAKGEIMICHSILYEDDSKFEEIICRLVGQGPIIKPGEME